MVKMPRTLDLEVRLVDPGREVMSAVEAVRMLIENEGPMPALHRKVVRAHRRDWPVLWKALDRLLRAQERAKRTPGATRQHLLLGAALGRLRAVSEAMDHLDVARAEGLVYTYGQIQRKVRIALGEIPDPLTGVREESWREMEGALAEGAEGGLWIGGEGAA